MTEIQYIGHILSAECLKPDQEMVRAIMGMSQPQDKAALMTRFLETVQYLSQLIPKRLVRCGYTQQICKNRLICLSSFSTPSSFRRSSVKERARYVLFWPSMSKKIEDIVLKCAVCNTFKKSNVKKTLMCHDIPDRSWAKLGVDLFPFDQSGYLLCVN